MPDDATVSELKSLLEQINGYDNPRRASTEWKQVYKLLQTTGLPAGRINAVAGMREPARLAEVIEELSAPEPTDADKPDPETLKRALKAFKKRAKLTRLDDESQLGRSPLTKGADKSLSAISPPNEYPQEVWDELTRQGRLRNLGHGMYELT
ncbi:MAG: hypothetical protein ACLFVU_04860 [Phycisphaerae bacterium]